MGSGRCMLPVSLCKLAHQRTIARAGPPDHCTRRPPPASAIRVRAMTARRLPRRVSPPPPCFGPTWFATGAEVSTRRRSQPPAASPCRARSTRIGVAAFLTILPR